MIQSPSASLFTGPIRIGMDAKRAFNNHTGLGNYSRFVISGLLTHGDPAFRLNLYTPRVNASLREWADHERAAICLPSGAGKLFTSAWRSLWLTPRLKKDGVRLYHGLSNEIPAGIEKSGIRSVVTIHDLIFLRYPDTYKPADRSIYKRKFSSACARADRIVATSRQTADDLAHFFGTDPSKVQVIYQDCHPRFHTQPDPAVSGRVLQQLGITGPYIICVSAFQQRKNHATLLKAFAEAQPLPHLLVLAGAPGDTSRQVQQLIHELQLGNRVRIIENIPGDQLPSLYHRADFGVYPSLFEGFGIPLLEALRMGLPMITGSAGCFAEVTGTAGLYADVSRPEEIAACIRELAENKALRDGLALKTQEESRRFDPALLTSQLQQLYTGLLL